MRIVYTNLQEDNFGVKRSVRHLQVDFSKKTPDRKESSWEKTLQDETRCSRNSLRSDNSLPVERQKVAHPGYIEQARSGDDNVAQRSSSRLACVQNADSLAGYYMRRFVETQLRTTSGNESGSQIDILV